MTSDCADRSASGSRVAGILGDRAQRRPWRADPRPAGRRRMGDTHPSRGNASLDSSPPARRFWDAGGGRCDGRMTGAVNAGARRSPRARGTPDRRARSRPPGRRRTPTDGDYRRASLAGTRLAAAIGRRRWIADVRWRWQRDAAAAAWTLVPVVADALVAGGWRRARAGDGVAAALVAALAGGGGPLPRADSAWRSWMPRRADVAPDVRASRTSEPWAWTRRTSRSWWGSASR